MRKLTSGVAVVTLSLIAATTWAGRAVFADPISTPSVVTRRISASPLLAVTSADKRLIAVGLRGLAVYSDDAGQTWKQAATAVASDLVSVQFATPKLGWASGHDGVILHTDDAGASWQKQVDGRRAAEITLAYYEKLSQQGDAAAAAAQAQAQANYQSGPDQPFLGVWFEDEQHGYAVGSFGLLMGTADGGSTWEPWLHHIDNPEGLNLNAVRGIGDAVYIAAERGTVFKLDRANHRFVALRTGYAGSFFDLVGEGNELLAFGLRGRAFRSVDGGSSWDEVKTGVDTGITAGVRRPDGRYLLVSQGGRVIESRDDGLHFKPIEVRRPDLFTGVASIGTSQFVLTGYGGISVESLQAEPK